MKPHMLITMRSGRRHKFPLLPGEMPNGSLTEAAEAFFAEANIGQLDVFYIGTTLLMVREIESFEFVNLPDRS